MYKALYRQYRPKTFDEVMGQEHITTTLKNQILNGNIGHAYLFSGTKGTGKTTTAKIFARAVNCTDLENGNPCNNCEICSGILNESIMDVIEMDAASNNSVDDVRELRDKIQYPPAKARYKVYIIDEVHMLSKGAFNALLKTLEEPPEHLIFVLATTEAERLPQTILSRCQRFDFRRITNKDIIINLKKICNELNIDYEESALQLIARNSEGSMRDALSLLDQCISFDDEKLTLENSLEILGITNQDVVFNMVDNLKERNLEKSLYIIDDIIQSGKDINQFIKDLIFHFRNLMIVKSSENPFEIIDMEKETVERYKIQSEDISLKFILKALDILNEGENQAKWSTQPRIILEMAIIKLVNLEEELTLEERVSRLEEAVKMGSISLTDREIKKEPKKVVKEEKIEKPVKKEQENITKDKIIDDGITLEISKVKEEWDLVLRYIKDKNVVVHALLIEGRPVECKNNLLTIGYREGYGIHKEAIESKHKEFVEEILSSYFNKNIRVKFVMEDEIIIENEDDDQDKNIQEVVDFFGEDFVEIKNN